jgi:hypothetical protein
VGIKLSGEIIGNRGYLLMERADRRDKVALDQAYEFYKQSVRDGGGNDLYEVANSLKTVTKALDAAESGQLELTLRLWRKIRQALFDQLLTNFPAYVVAITSDGRILNHREALPDDCTIELHPTGLKRDDDVFHLPLSELHPHTRARLDRVWMERGPATRKEDFTHLAECDGGVCTMRPNTFIIGDEVLVKEATSGREKAYSHYWSLYWQSYCSPSPREKQYLTRQMASLEAVWGNLHY